MAGRKPKHQLQYMAEEGDRDIGGAPGQWCNAVTVEFSNDLGPGSLKEARQSKRAMSKLYPDTPYRIISIKTQEVVA